MNKNKPNSVITSKQNVVKLVSNIIKDYNILCLGSGSTVNLLIDHLANNSDRLKVISASSSTSNQLSNHNITEISIHSISQLSNNTNLICVDGADQLIYSDKIIIKGHGNALLKEKILWKLCDQVIVMIDQAKLNDILSVTIPIEIIPDALELVNIQFDKQNISGELNIKEINQNPVITDNGNFILELQLDEKIDLLNLHTILKSFVGVVETGIFDTELVNKSNIYVGYPDVAKKYQFRY